MEAPSDAELRMLLLDCLTLWEIRGQVEAAADGVTVIVRGDRFEVARVAAELRPARWLLQTPERAAVGRAARAVPGIGALLSSLRNALGAAPGARLRIGA